MESRKELFEFYDQFDSPILNITVEIKISNIIPDLKKRGISFFQLCVYALCCSTNENENFKLRFDGEKIYKTQRIIPSYTVLREGGDFNFCTFEFDLNWNVFLTRSLEAKKKSETSKVLLKDDISHQDYIFMTCLPWFKFSSIQHPVGSFKKSTIPSFAIGQFSFCGSSGGLGDEPQELSFPLSIQVHHGLVDGLHIAQFIKSFEKNLVTL